MSPEKTRPVDIDGNVIIRDADAEDVDAIVQLSLELQLGILSTLSPAIIRLYFGNIVKKDVFACRVLCPNGSVGGFHVINTDTGVSRARPFYSTPLESSLKIATSPVSLWIMMAYFLSHLKGLKNIDYGATPFKGELLYVGIRETCQGLGYGNLLLADMKGVMAQHSIKHIGLKVLKDDKRAQNFYRRCSPEFIGETIFSGVRSDVIRIHRDNLPT